MSISEKLKEAIKFEKKLIKSKYNNYIYKNVGVPHKRFKEFMKKSALTIDLVSLNCSKRLRNARFKLHSYDSRKKSTKLGDFTKLTKKEFLKLQGVGKGTADELEYIFKEFGLSWTE